MHSAHKAGSKCIMRQVSRTLAFKRSKEGWVRHTDHTLTVKHIMLAWLQSEHALCRGMED